jgi:hypothetical protein
VYRRDKSVLTSVMGQIAPSILNEKFIYLPRAFTRLPRAQAEALKYFSSGLSVGFIFFF